MPMTPFAELEQLRRQRAGQAVDLGDAVADLDDGADAGDVGPLVESLDLAANDRRDLVGSDRHQFPFLRLDGGQARPQPLEAAPNARVIEPVADADGDAADQDSSTTSLISISSPVSSWSRSSTSSRCVVVQRERGPHLGQRDATLAAHQARRNARPWRDRPRSAAPDHEQDQVERLRRETSLGHAPDDALLVGERHRRMLDQRAQLGRRPAPHAAAEVALPASSVPSARPISKAASA